MQNTATLPRDIRERRRLSARYDVPRLLPAENLENVGEVVELLPAGRRGAADGVEPLAVLEAVIRDALDAAALVEIDRDHALIGGLLRQERGLLGARRDVIEDFAGHRGDG